jgi:GH15 family glucan-1,4-alpha-glucosidase
MKKIGLKLILVLLIPACYSGISPEPEMQTEPVTAASRDLISTVLGDAPNFAQTSNGNFSAVISRNYGRGAKAGAIIEFLYPLYARDHLWDAYNGIYYKNKLYWFHDLELVKQSVRDDTGIIVSEFKTKDNKLQLKTEDVALRGNDTLVRNLEITNSSNEDISDLKLFFYEFLTVNYLGAGDKLNYNENTGVLSHYDDNIYFSIGSDQKPEQWQCGGAENLITSAYDARKDAEDGVLRKNSSVKGLIGLGVNGSIGHSLPVLKGGQKFSLNYYISAGKSAAASSNNFNRAKSLKWETIKSQELSYWQSWLAQARKPAAADEKTAKVYRRSLITMKQDTADNGAVIASPTLLTPVYAFTWPRDGSITASAYLEAGYTEEARKFIDFIITQQKENGGWAVNYFMDGSRPLWDFGDRKNEHDQVGTVIWIINEYYKKTRDLGWLKAKWPVVKKAGEFLLDFDSEKDLMTSCRDLWELNTDKSWTFTNAAAYAGLKSGAEIAGLAGDPVSQSRFSQSADRMKKAIYDKLWSEAGQYYIRGIDPETGSPDSKVETANLGLSYPFAVFPYKDPRMALMADKIFTELTTAGKGVRRYTGDRYYDGNPWPATTDWLAIYYARQGNRERALQLHNTVTGYAYHTGSLMLGEQFDEQKRLWVSAFPLTWSASKYVLATLDLYQ